MNLSTERLLLRRFKEADLSDALEYLSDPVVMKYIEPAFDRQKAKKFIRTCGLEKDPLVYALVHKGDKKVLGHVIFHEFNHPDEFELGWVIGKKYWGQGLATEIGRKIIDFGMKRNPDYNENLPVWSILTED